MNSNKRIQARQIYSFKKVFSVIGLSLLALLYLQFGIAAARMSIWLQAMPVFLASVSIIVGANRISHNKRASVVVFWGTLPAWLFHIPTTIIFKDESPIFVIATGITPIVAGIFILLSRKK